MSDLTPTTLTTGSRPATWGQAWRALRHRDFRLYWLALSVSLFGVAFQTMAQGWLIYRLTGESFKLGLVGFLAAGVAGPATLVGGFIADRVPRHRLVIVTQAAMSLPPLTIAWLVWTDQIQIWHIVVATAALGAIAGLDLPSRTALVSHLVPPDDMNSAQGLSSAARQVVQMVGAALAGILIVRFGEALCFFFNGVSYLAMVAALLMMTPQLDAPREKRRVGRGDLLGGLKYMFGDRAVLGVFALAAVQGLFLTPYLILLPAFATDVLQREADGFGWLNAAVGLGSLIAALLVASLRPQKRGWVMLGGGVLAALALGAFAWSRTLPSSMFWLALAGLGNILITAVAATLMLVMVPDELRGRVNSMGILVYLGAPQVGGLAFTYAADRWSAPLAVTAMALLCLASVAVINLAVPQVRAVE